MENTETIKEKENIQNKPKNTDNKRGRKPRTTKSITQTEKEIEIPNDTNKKIENAKPKSAREKELVEKVAFIAINPIPFEVEIYRERYNRKNYFRIYRDNIPYSDGECEKEYTAKDIFGQLNLQGFELRQ